MLAIDVFARVHLGLVARRGLKDPKRPPRTLGLGIRPIGNTSVYSRVQIASARSSTTLHSPQYSGPVAYRTVVLAESLAALRPLYSAYSLPRTYYVNDLISGRTPTHV